MSHAYTYRDTLAASERVRWRVDDLLGPEERLEFDSPFLPESLARVEPLRFLSPRARLALNHIRGHGYLYTFGLVEEFILPYVLDHTRPSLDQDDYRTRALLAFANEEAKHIQLFKRFRNAFVRDFGVDCQVIGPPQAIAEEVLSRDPLSVAILILHIEWMTQRHFQDSVRDDTGLDGRFKSLLRHHWMEEAQHAQLDTLMVEEEAAKRSPEEIEEAIEGYLGIGGFLDAGLKQQAEFDLAALEQAIGRVLDDGERKQVLDVQHQALRWTFLGTGMTHPHVLETLETIRPGWGPRLTEIAKAFS